MASNGFHDEEGGGEDWQYQYQIYQSLVGSSDVEDGEVEDNQEMNVFEMRMLEQMVKREENLHPNRRQLLASPTNPICRSDPRQELSGVVEKKTKEVDHLEEENKLDGTMLFRPRTLIGNAASVNSYGNAPMVDSLVNYSGRFESDVPFEETVQDEGEGSFLSFGYPVPHQRSQNSFFPDNQDPRGTEQADMTQRRMWKSNSKSRRSYANTSQNEVEVKRQPSTKGVTDEAKQQLLALPGMAEASLSVLYLARVVPTDEPAYADILEYINNSQEHNFGVKLVKLIRVVRNGVKEFEHDRQYRNRFRMMLWHGTKKANVASILTNGLKPPPPKNQMAGPGIYFADRISKSCQYCDGTAAGTTGYLFLCDVFLGQMFYTAKPHPEFTEVPKGRKSIYYAGKKVPDRSGNKVLNGSTLPCGPTIDNPNAKLNAGSVIFNEYIKFDASETRAMYLAQVEFAGSKVS